MFSAHYYTDLFCPSLFLLRLLLVIVMLLFYFSSSFGIFTIAIVIKRNINTKSCTYLVIVLSYDFPLETQTNKSAHQPTPHTHTHTRVCKPIFTYIPKLKVSRPNLYFCPVHVYEEKKSIELFMHLYVKYLCCTVNHCI